jgi:hypothetical protein
VNLC